MLGHIADKFHAWRGSLSSNIQYLEFDHKEPFKLHNAWQLDCGLVEDSHAYLIFIEREGSTFLYNPAKKTNRGIPTRENTAVVSIASSNEPYNTFFKENLLDTRLYKYIVFYGDTDCTSDNAQIQTCQYPLNMSEARNRGIDMCQHEFMLILDIDTHLDDNDLDMLFSKYVNYHHHGIFTPRNENTGNGFAFGRTEYFKHHKYCERFKGFFFEDTEYLTNWARRGTPMTHTNTNFVRKKHDPQGGGSDNLALFQDIMFNGR